MKNVNLSHINFSKPVDKFRDVSSCFPSTAYWKGTISRGRYPSVKILFEFRTESAVLRHPSPGTDGGELPFAWHLFSWPNDNIENFPATERGQSNSNKAIASSILPFWFFFRAYGKLSIIGNVIEEEWKFGTMYRIFSLGRRKISEKHICWSKWNFLFSSTCSYSS